MKSKLVVGLMLMILSLGLIGCNNNDGVETLSSTSSSSSKEENKKEGNKKKDDEDIKSSSIKDFFDFSTMEKTILDTITLYETTVDDIETYLKDKEIIYSIRENDIATQVSNDFLGYTCLYSFEFQDAISLIDKYGEVFYELETVEENLIYSEYGDESLRKIYPEHVVKSKHGYSAEDTEHNQTIYSYEFNIAFQNNEEFIEGGKKITEYLKKKSDKLDDYDIVWDTEDNATIYPIKVTTVLDEEYIDYIYFEQRNSADETNNGYYPIFYNLEYDTMTKENWYINIAEIPLEVEEEDEVIPDYLVAYKEFLSQYQSTSSVTPKITKAYIDDDDIPELIVHEDTEGVNIYTYHNNQVSHVGQFSSSLLWYNRFKNEIFSVSSNSEALDSGYYTIENGSAKLTKSVTYIDTDEDELLSLISNYSVVKHYNNCYSLDLDDVYSDLSNKDYERLKDTPSFEEKIQEIDEYCKNIDSNLDSFPVTQDEDSYVMYYEYGYPVKIVGLPNDSSYEVMKMYFKNKRLCYFSIGEDALIWYGNDINDTLRISMYGECLDYLDIIYDEVLFESYMEEIDDFADSYEDGFEELLDEIYPSKPYFITEDTVYGSSITIPTYEETSKVELQSQAPREQEASVNKETIDVKSEIDQIRDYYYTTQNYLSSYMLEESPNMTMYHEAGFPVKIFVKSGYNDWDYTREYFYHDQELYFAFVYKNNEQHRLYFKDGIMIRYIDENSNTFDYGSLDAYSEWADKVKSESDNIYPTMPNCGA